MSGEPAFPGSEDGMMNIHESLSGKRFSLAASVLACYKMGQHACGRCLEDVFIGSVNVFCQSVYIPFPRSV